MSGLTGEINKGLGDKFRAGVGWKGSLDEYLELVRQDVRPHIRTSVQYIADMIEHFGYTDYLNCGQKIRHYKIFDDPFVVGEGVFGQDRMLMELVSQMRMTGKGSEERIIVLRGPVATAKSTIVRLLMRGAEEYSRLPEGGVYTFNWVFPMEGGKEMGFLAKQSKHGGSFARLKRSEAVANVPCQMNDLPLLLYPRQQRRELLEKIIAESGKKVRIPPKLIKSELCFNCQTIYDKMLEEYDGDLKKVMGHVQVERVGFSEIRKIGCATIFPSTNSDGQAPIIAMEVDSYRNIAEKLKGISLHKFSGKWVDANRGIIHFSDIFKRPAHSLQYLLNAVQEHNIDFNEVQGYIDVLILATTNLEEYAVLSDPRSGFNKGLLNRIWTKDVGYILQPSEEAKIYERRFNGLGYATIKGDEEDKHIMPHVNEMLGLWCVLTRLKKPSEENLKKSSLDPDLMILGSTMPSWKKAKLYDGKIASRFSFARKKSHDFELRHLLKMADARLQRALRNEYPDEGMSGISPRNVQDLITRIISTKEDEEAKSGWNCACLSFSRLQQGLVRLVEPLRTQCVGSEDDKQGKIDLDEKAVYGDMAEYLAAIQREYNNLVTKDVVMSFIGMPEPKRKGIIDNYLDHAEADVAGNTREGMPDERILQRIEDLMGIVAGDRISHRKWLLERRNDLMRKIMKVSGCGETDYMIGKDFIYDELFKPLTMGLFRERVRLLDMNNDEFLNAVRSHGTKDFDSFNPDQQAIVSLLLETLIRDYNYCESCVKSIVSYAFVPHEKARGSLITLKE